MECKILIAQAEIDSIAAEWEALQKRSHRNIFTAYGWFDAWWRHLGMAQGCQLHIVTGRNREGNLVAVAPMVVTRCKGLRILSWAGSEIADYSDFLLDDPLLAEELWHFIRQSPYFDIARLKEVHPEACCQEPLKRFGRVIRSSPSRQICVEWPSADAWRAALPASTRQFQRKRTRKLEAEGRVTYEVFRSEPLDEEAFSALLRHKKEWSELYGLGGVFRCAGAGAFFRDIARREAAQGHLHFSVLRCGGEVAAAHLGFVAGGTFYCYMPAYSLKWQRFSPGKILLLHCVAWAIDNGCREFDFMRGEQEFKDWLANSSRALNDYAFAVTLKGKLALFLFGLAKRKRFRQKKHWRDKVIALKSKDNRVVYPAAFVRRIV